jgi:DHA2 family multidrug resistance protein
MLNGATDTGRALLDLLITQQAAIIAYANDFKLLMYLTLATIPFVILVGSSRARPGQRDEVVAHEM